VTGTDTGVTRDVCRDFARSSKLEWLETNGAGAFAMGTVSGVNTRRYHALLVASPLPEAGRHVLLSRLEEEIECGGATFQIGACQYPGTVAPRGFELLEEFRWEPCAYWRYAAGDATLERQVYLVPGRAAVVIRYRASRAVTLRVRPFIAFRDYHSLAHANSVLDPRAVIASGLIRLKPYASLPALELHSPGEFAADPHWYNNVEYLEEMERGLDFREDLFTPGVLRWDLAASEWVSLCASIDHDAIESLKSQPPAHKADPFFVRRADGQPTIMAGYPWFTDWGRDTMISLPGLLIAPGRLAEARSVIEGFLACRSNGLIPNRFPDRGSIPEYNTADATLWMFQAVRAWLAAGGDRAFLRDLFYPAAKEIVDWHFRGTSFNIRVDPRDHLLSAGAPGAQLTWMDAKIGDWVVTPRQGKAVEINALWHGALRLMVEWARTLGDSRYAQYELEADRLRESFGARFWNLDRQCLYDLVTDSGPVATLRPNQIFAVSLPFALLAPDRNQAIVRIVERELLTPVGLRTLERKDPDYKPRYQGSPAERDAAYHQGTVWPWLLGPFIDAYLSAFGQTPQTLAYCRGLVDRLEAESARSGCLGSIAEIYDAEEPRFPRGCPAQAWSVAEAARVRAAYRW
jgi:glycogen debranching enzyme